jgi:type I restriction enzyme S subunit
MRLTEASIDDALLFFNGKAAVVQDTGNFTIFGSNGPIGFTNEFNHETAIILGRVGAYCGSVDICDDKFWASDNTIVVKPKPSHSLHYWYYRLKSLSLGSYAGGAAQPLITHGILRGVKTSYHSDFQQQCRIASILSTYDDLIENNRRRMTLLEEVARQVYQEWFVRLRFPGYEHTRIVDGVPEGWERKTLREVCFDVRETVLPEALEPDTPYIGLEHMPRRSISLTEWEGAEKVTSTKLRFREGEILFGKIRPYFHKVGIAFVDGVVSSDALVIRPTEVKLNGLVLMTVSSDPFVANTSQTMREGSKMPRADWKQMKDYPVAVPPDGLLTTFNDTIGSVTAQLKNLTFQNQRLRTARDLLLPKLMSGEILPITTEMRT